MVCDIGQAPAWRLPRNWGAKLKLRERLMGYNRKTIVGATFRLVLVGALLGTLAAIAYAALCCVVWWVMVSAISWMNAGNIENALALGVRFALAGAAAGALLGLCVAIDHSRTGMPCHPRPSRKSLRHACRPNPLSATAHRYRTWSAAICKRLREDNPMEPFNLAVWLPALLALGLAGMGLMFAFVLGCERV
jgi:hypothetical protein